MPRNPEKQAFLFGLEAARNPVLSRLSSDELWNVYQSRIASPDAVLGESNGGFLGGLIGRYRHTSSVPKAEFMDQLKDGMRPEYKNLTPEYAWRVERGKRQGFTRSQARGHARKKKGEKPISEVKRSITKRWQQDFASGTHHRYFRVKTREGILFVLENERGMATRVFVDVPVDMPWQTEDASGNVETHRYVRTPVVSLKQSVNSVVDMLNGFIDDLIADNTTNSTKALTAEPGHFVVILASPLKKGAK